MTTSGASLDLEVAEGLRTEGPFPSLSSQSRASAIGGSPLPPGLHTVKMDGSGGR